MRNKSNKSLKPFRNGLYALIYTFKICPTYLVIGIILFTMVTLQAPLFTVAATTSLNQDTYTPVIIFAIFALLTQLLNLFYTNIYAPIITAKMNKKTSLLIYQKSISIDLEKLNNPEQLNKLKTITDESERRLDNVAEKLFKFISNLVLLLLSSFIISKDPIILLVSILAAGSLILNNYFWAKYNYQFAQKLAQPSRTMGYVKRIFFLPQYRFNNALNNTELVEQKYDQSVENCQEVIKDKGKKILRYDLIQIIALPIAIFIILYRMASSIKSGSSIYEAVLIISSFNWILSSLSSLFMIYPEFVQEGLFFKDFKDFVESKVSEENKGAILLNNSKIKIEFKDVNFSYQSDRPILSNLNLVIEDKKRIAIVGRNGAGKTTFLNLLLRLYEPTSGNIFLNESEYKYYSNKEVIKTSGVVEQNVLLYAISIGENILGRKLVTRDDYSKVTAALEIVDMKDKIEALPNKIDTIYSKEFDDNGIYFSKGEMQRIAIARAIVHNPRLLILDEASSALDPLVEYSINKKLLEVLTDRTVIMVSHSLAITKLMDRIFYIENGEIIEDGTHEELMALNQKYAEMYRLQKASYATNIPAY